MTFTFRTSDGKLFERETFDTDQAALAFGTDLAERFGVKLEVTVEIATTRQSIGTCWPATVEYE